MSLNPAEWALWFAVTVFVAAAAVTVFGSLRLTQLGDQLADRTGWGEAIFGAVLLGAATSLSGIVMTAAAALDARPGLAYSNAVGGVAAQTVALAVADLAYRRANLEHAAASLSNIFSGLTLILLLGVAAALPFLPDVTMFGIHYGSAALLITYLYSLKISREIGSDPMWQAKETPLTRRDSPEEDAADKSTKRLLIPFGLFGILVAAAGWAIAEAAGEIVAQTPLDETQVGALLMGITNALPETVVAVTAVRRGALTLAVAGVLGGNAFDVLNLAVGDVAWRGGSLFHVSTDQQKLILLLTLLMTSVLVGGLIRRERQGPGGIGLESILVLGLYGVAALTVWF